MSKDWLAEAEGASPGTGPAPSSAPESDWLENAKAGVEGALSSIPGGEYLANKIGHALHPEISAQQLQDAGEAIQGRAPTSAAVGNLAGTLAQGAALPMGGASLVGKMATQAAIGAALTPAYKLGETANQAELQGTPLSAEQIRQAFSLDDILKSAGLSALTAGLLHGAASTPGLLSKGSTRAAQGQAEAALAKAATKVGMSAEDLADFSLQNNLFEPGAVQAKLKDVSTRLDSFKAEITPAAGELTAKSMATRLNDHAQQYEQFAPLEGARNYLGKISKRLANDKYQWAGEELQDLMNQVSSKARTLKDPSQKAFLQDALQLMREEYSTTLDLLNPSIGSAYKAALADYKIYKNIESALNKTTQATGKDVAKMTALVGAGALGIKTSGLAGGALEAGAAMAGIKAVGNLKTKNFANLAQKFAKATTPGSLFETRVTQAANTLMKGATDWIARLPAKDLHARYEELSASLQKVVADPTAAAQNLRQQLDFLPQQQADAVTGQIMDQLQTHAIETQTQTGVTTVAGLHTVKTDREKRETLRKIEASHDPFYAISTGSPALIREAEKYHPETVKEIKKRVLSDISTRKNLPFFVKRRVSGILGLAGTPTQDPLLGGTLQTIILNKRQSESAQGQVNSTRNRQAGLKKDMEAATRVQNLMKLGTGGK